ncbi:MAG: HAMP domain-containing histidine kinase [Deltaproteobacteria bacterium]|nr:HAMP domain-containing histidine kinase [Deltaproteobacteria bacterium]
MAMDDSGIHEMSLNFFGKISASISHEIRNVLAVINENAGLMKDLLLMADKGQPLDHGRISRQTEKILEQVLRADGIIGNMNRFAHSVDDVYKTVDVGECLRLVAALSGRFAAMREVALSFNTLSETIEITTCPFLLENIIYLCLDYAMSAAGKEKTVDMIVKKHVDGAQIRFSGLEKVGETVRGLLSDAVEDLLGYLGAKIDTDEKGGAVVLTLPAKIAV